MSEVQNIMPQSPWQGMQQPMPTAEQQAGQDINTYQQLQKQLQQQAGQGRQLQLQNLQTNLGMQKLQTEQPQQMDLTPLMALTDAWTGSKFAQSYKTPESPQERQALLMKMGQEVDKDSTAMNEQQVQILKAQLETQMRKEERDYQLQMLQAQRDQTAALREQARGDKMDEKFKGHLETAQKGWQTDKVAEEATKRLNEAQGLEETIDGAVTDPALAQELTIKRARFEVPGRLNETELSQLGVTSMGDLSTKLGSIFEKAKEGTITPEAAQFLKAALATEKAHVQAVVEDRAAQHAQQFGKVTGTAPEKAVELVTGGTFGPDILKPKDQRGATQGGKAPKGNYSKGDMETGKDGKKYKFQGGDATDSKNWKEVQ